VKPFWRRKPFRWRKQAFELAPAWLADVWQSPTAQAETPTEIIIILKHNPLAVLPIVERPKPHRKSNKQ
jgi:hypothetical protein